MPEGSEMVSPHDRNMSAKIGVARIEKNRTDSFVPHLELLDPWKPFLTVAFKVSISSLFVEGT